MRVETLRVSLALVQRDVRIVSMEVPWRVEEAIEPCGIGKRRGGRREKGKTGREDLVPLTLRMYIELYCSAWYVVLGA